MSLETRWLAFVRERPTGPKTWPTWAALHGLAWVYRATSGAHRAMYRLGLRRARVAPMPVISVGNLTLGGTGKTEFAILLVKMLLGLGAKPCLLLRGYRRGEAEAGDEATVMRERLPGIVPVLEDRDRARAVLQAHRQGARVAVLDDGHQHQKIRKDLTILLFDASRPEDLQRLFPAGLLREPLRVVASADLVCLTRVDQAEPGAEDGIAERIARCGYEGPILRAEHGVVCLHDPATGEVAPPSSLRGKACIAVSGLGNNAAFAESLRSLGADVVEHLCVPDHHVYTPVDVTNLAELQDRQPGSMVVTTAKDAPRLLPAADALTVYVLHVEMRLLAGQEALRAQVRRLLTEGGVPHEA